MTVMETVKMLLDGIAKGDIDPNWKMGAQEPDYGGCTTVECTGWDTTPSWGEHYLVLN